MYPANAYVVHEASEADARAVRRLAGEVGGVVVSAVTRRRRRWSGWWAAFPRRFGTRMGRPRSVLSA